MNTILWQPKHPEKTQMHAFMRFVEKRYNLQFGNYAALHHWSVTKASDFWASLCEFFNLQFNSPATEICTSYQTMLDAHWFKGATFNFAEKLLAKKDDHLAIISINEDGVRHTISYEALEKQVMAVAAGLKKAGINAGDRVAAVMPNVTNTIIAMLATASLGAIWSSCSPDFGAQAIIDRLTQIQPKILFACDGHQYFGKEYSAVDKIKALVKAISSIDLVVITPVIYNDSPLESGVKTITWDDFLIPDSYNGYEPFPFAHPLYILFSSGTTGKPKCIMHSTGGTLVQHLKELGLHTDLRADDKLFFYTTCGWMMWNWMVSALSLGTTLILYEGSPTYPNTHHLFKIIADEGVTVFGTSAKFISSIEKAGIRPIEYLADTKLKSILSTGSPLLPFNFDFVYQAIKHDVQLSSISGGTDIVSCFALGNPILPVYRGELQCIGLGMDVAVFDEKGKPVYETRGEMVCIRPFPSMPIGFWQDPNKTLYIKAYFLRFPGVWTHGDYAEITAHQGMIIYGRSDTVLNPGGVRIGTAEIYRQVEKIPEVADSVAIGQDWQNDVRIVLFVKLKDEQTLDDFLIAKIKQTIKINASPRHVPAIILQVPDIPRTLSGKVVELAVRQIVHGEAVANRDSIANPEALAYFKDRV